MKTSAPTSPRARPIDQGFYEKAHATYFRYPCYWSGPYLWGFGPEPMLVQARNDLAAPSAAEQHELEEAERAASESHLRSTAEVVGYKLQALDGPAGRVDDFVVDDRDWSIDSMVVDTREWLPGGEVLVPPKAITEIDWHERQVNVALTRAQVRSKPLAPT